MEPKYPEIEVELTGTDSNVFAMIAAVSRAMRNAGVEKAEIEAFQKEVRETESWDAALRCMMSWVEVS